MQVLGRARNRTVLFGVLILACAVLALFPQRYLASASLTPTDPESLGLSGTLGQLGAINNVFGNQAAIEIALRVGRSVDVRETVMRKLDLPRRMDEPDRTRLHRWLSSHVVVRSLRGGIVLITLQDTDPDLARDIVAAYTVAIRDQLAVISRRQTAYKRDVLLELVDEATARLSRAQTAYDRFRLTNRAALPEAQISTVSARIAALEAGLKARQVDLQVARQTFTDEHLTVKQIKAEMATMQGQLAALKATSPGADTSVGRVVGQSSELYRLERELNVAKALYESYLRYLQGTAVEDMTSTASVRLLEEPFIDTSRQVWLPAAVLGVALALLWAAVEFYRLRPPAGSGLGASRRGDAADA